MYLFTWLEAILRNVRIGVRSLLRVPILGAAVTFTLALGIGANSAVFSAIYAVLLRPMPFPNADQLVKLTQSQPKIPQGRRSAGPARGVEQPQQHLPCDYRLPLRRRIGNFR